MTFYEQIAVEQMYERYGYRCFLHGLQATQRAHIIGNTKPNRKIYGDKVIDNPLNWLPAHSLECNKSCDIGVIPMAQDEIANIILSDLPEEDKRELIEGIVKAKAGIDERG